MASPSRKEYLARQTDAWLSSMLGWYDRKIESTDNSNRVEFWRERRDDINEEILSRAVFASLSRPIFAGRTEQQINSVSDAYTRQLRRALTPSSRAHVREKIKKLIAFRQGILIEPGSIRAEKILPGTLATSDIDPSFGPELNLPAGSPLIRFFQLNTEGFPMPNTPRFPELRKVIASRHGISPFSGTQFKLAASDKDYDLEALSKELTSLEEPHSIRINGLGRTLEREFSQDAYLRFVGRLVKAL